MTEQELLESGYRKYSGETIDIFYEITEKRNRIWNFDKTPIVFI